MEVRPIDANAMLNELKPVGFEAYHSAVLLSDVSKMMREWVERQPTLTPPNEPLTIEQLRERLAADEWIDPAVELPPDDDMVLAIVSGKPADNITLEDAYELASYGSEGWIIEQYELWETPTVTWWRPLPDPPEKKKEER